MMLTMKADKRLLQYNKLSQEIITNGEKQLDINKIIKAMFHGLYTACFSATPKYRSITYESVLTTF